MKKPCLDERTLNILSLLELDRIIKLLSKDDPYKNLRYYVKAYYAIKKLINKMGDFPDYPPRNMRSIIKNLIDLEKEGWIDIKDVKEVVDNLADRISSKIKVPFARAYAKRVIKEPRSGKKAKSSVAFKKYHLDYIIFMIIREIEVYLKRKSRCNQNMYRFVAALVGRIDPQVIGKSRNSENIIKQRYNELIEHEVIKKFVMFSTLSDGFRIDALTDWPDKPTGYLKSFLDKLEKYDNLNQ